MAQSGTGSKRFNFDGDEAFIQTVDRLMDHYRIAKQAVFFRALVDMESKRVFGLSSTGNETVTEKVERRPLEVSIPATDLTKVQADLHKKLGKNLEILLRLSWFVTLEKKLEGDRDEERNLFYPSRLNIPEVMRLIREFMEDRAYKFMYYPKTEKGEKGKQKEIHLVFTRELIDDFERYLIVGQDLLDERRLSSLPAIPDSVENETEEPLSTAEEITRLQDSEETEDS